MRTKQTSVLNDGTMKRAVFFGLMATSCAVAAAMIKCSSLTVELDEACKGAVSRLVTANGAELGTASETTPLFSLKTTRIDDLMKSEDVTADDAGNFKSEKIADGVKLVYSGFAKGGAESVVCTVRGVGESVRWSVSVQMKDGWALEKTTYPRVLASEVFGTSSGDDRILYGCAKGGVVYSPGDKKVGWSIGAMMPGALAAQFATMYDDRAGLYYAVEDGDAYCKTLGAKRIKEGIVIETARTDFERGTVVQAYDVVTAGFEGTPGNPCTWHDAADIYKKWAHKQFWTTVPFRDRTDVPKWMRDAPAMVRFGRNWLQDPDTIRKWMSSYWKKHFVAAPLVMAYWGWEKRGYWITPDYFPVVPDNETFAKLMGDMKALGGHGFPWPSGYHWTTTYDKKPDGNSFTWDDRERFKQYESHAVFNRDGKRYVRIPSWLRGGDCACMCAGDPWTIDWWNNDICLPLAKMGCEMIQVDQVVGGAFPACFAKNHPHAPGNGKWKSEVFLKQLVTMRDVMRTAEKDSVVAVEEPCEYYNHLVGIQDYRDCESAADEWASVFNYVYHEYLPCFQSNPRRGVWQAYTAAEGQIPFFTASMSDIGADITALRNGSFETARDGVPTAWEKLSGYNGQVWNGRCYIDKETKHDGEQSVRLEVAKGENAVQVSQNISVDSIAFRKPGMKYRLSAWLKTKHSKCPNSVNYCFLGSKARGGTLPFPKSEEGWKFVTSTFTPPTDGDATLRIMMHVSYDAIVWVDGMKVEEISPDGVVRDVILEAGKSANDDFMRRWVALYHGEGRDWLAHGRMVKPPRVICAQNPYEANLHGGWVKQKGMKPVVFCAAFETLEGRRAVMLVNSTASAQKVTLLDKGNRRTITLEANGIRLLKD